MLKVANAQEAAQRAAADNVFYTGVLYALTPVVHAAPLSPETLRALKNARQEERTEFTRRALEAVKLESLLREGQDEYEFALTMPARRIQFWCGEGVVSVFAISGNAWRAMARRLVARFTLDALGLADGEVPLEVLRALFSGGTLAKGLKSKPPSRADFSAELRATVPPFDVFGGCLNSFMVPGSLRVGFVAPVTQETERVLFSGERFARVRETVRREREEILPTAEAIKPQVYTYTRQRIAELLEEQDGDGSSRRGQDKDQMVYAVEAVPAGLHFGHWVGLVGPAGEGSRLCLEAAIALLGRAGFLGGRGAVGHGLFAMRYWTDEGRPLDFDACLDAYRSWLQLNCDRAKTMLVETIMKETGYLVPERVKKSLKVWIRCRDLLAEDGESDALKVGEFAAWLRENRFLREDVAEASVSAGLKDLRRIVDGLSDAVKQGLAEVTEAEISSTASLVERFGIRAESAKQAVRQLESQLRAIAVDSWLNKTTGGKNKKADRQDGAASAETAKAG